MVIAYDRLTPSQKRVRDAVIGFVGGLATIIAMAAVAYVAAVIATRATIAVELSEPIASIVAVALTLTIFLIAYFVLLAASTARWAPWWYEEYFPNVYNTLAASGIIVVVTLASRFVV